MEVKILSHTLNGMPIFLARLTQRGHVTRNMDDVTSLYLDTIEKIPSERLLKLPHTTLQRMSSITMAITNISTKAASQLRTHARSLTFISTSTQYSDYGEYDEDIAVPSNLSYETKEYMLASARKIKEMYNDALRSGIDNDTASYLLPLGFKKILIVHGTLDAWTHFLQERLCLRNSPEVVEIAKACRSAIWDVGPNYTCNMYPSCVLGECKEGTMSCKRGMTLC